MTADTWLLSLVFTFQLEPSTMDVNDLVSRVNTTFESSAFASDVGFAASYETLDISGELVGLDVRLEGTRTSLVADAS